MSGAAGKPNSHRFTPAKSSAKIRATVLNRPGWKDAPAGKPDTPARDARPVPLRQEQIGGHAEMFRQRADVRQCQLPFAAQDHRAQVAAGA